MAPGLADPPPTPVRRAARVVLLDPDNPVLLMRYDLAAWRWWTLTELAELIRQELGDA